MRDLDAIDIKIINLLLEQYRSADEIQKIMQLEGKPLSARTIAHRIKQLQDEGVITKTIRFNHHDVGYGRGLLLVKTVNQAASDSVKEYLGTNEHVYELSTGSGGFDIVASYYIREMGSRNIFVRSIRNFSGVEKLETIDLEISNQVGLASTHFGKLRRGVLFDGR